MWRDLGRPAVALKFTPRTSLSHRICHSNSKTRFLLALLVGMTLNFLTSSRPKRRDLVCPAVNPCYIYNEFPYYYRYSG
jgi:hypothetical protein